MSTTDETLRGDDDVVEWDGFNPEDEAPDAIPVRIGRQAAFTAVADWVSLADIHEKAKRLYGVLCMHVNEKRGDRNVWPTQRSLAKLMNVSRGDKLKPFLDELVAIDAIEITKFRYKGGMRVRNLYTVHELPPEGYQGPVTLKAWYAANRLELDKPAPRRGKKATRDS